MSTQEHVEPAPGDLVEVSRHHVGDATRVGEVMRVLGDGGRPRVVVRWEDGHESVLYASEATFRKRKAHR